ncbi:MAG: PQQ-binding-like beta-propeller repeat protein [Pirellulaceae bacterium]|nr:PQQ-binding-like beta-propeller repeat protein [Pirellulaceae bacterium]
MKRFWHLFLALAFLTCSISIATAADDAKIDPLDWPYWRGPEGNSISRETGLPDTINPRGGAGSNLLWKKEGAAGRGTPIILRGKIYLLTRDNPGTALEREKVMCLDAATGETVWESKFNVWSSAVPDTRVGWSSPVGDPATGKIYALGANGLFQCLDGESGKTLWSSPLHERYGLVSTYGGRTNYPIVVDDLVILGSVTVGWGENGTPAHRLFGFDKATGELRWQVNTRLRPEDTIHSGPTVAVFNGQKVILTGSGDGWLYALQPQTGKKVWEYHLSRRGLNMSPTVDGDVVYIGHSEENPRGTKFGAVAALHGNLTGNITGIDYATEKPLETKGEIWKELGMGVGKSSILKFEDRIYCCDDSGKMNILEAATGEPIGRQNMGTTNYASPLYADGKIYHLEMSRWYVLTPDEELGVKKPARKTFGTFDEGIQCWSSPIVSHGRLYLQTTGALYCFEDEKKEKGSEPRPKQPEATPLAEGDKPTQVQVVPYETLLRPGDKQDFKVRLFNARGQLLKESPAEFTLTGPGEITKEGAFTAAKENNHTTTAITAKAGDLTGKARLRTIPPLPWKFDFEGLKDPPATWVGARHRHVVRNVDDSTAMVKITTIPKGTRSRLSMGQSDLHDYTIQGDFKAGKLANKIPDFGVIAQGYTFFFEGEIKRMQIQSWQAHDRRTFVAQKFVLEPEVWYTLKLRAENSDKKAVLRAKIWKRGEKEPADWTLELIDPQPNTVGSPGLYGDATNAEIFIDNIAVTQNE